MSEMNNKEIEKLKKQNAELSNTIDSISADYNITLRKIAHEFGNALTLINSSLQIIQSSHPEVRAFKYWDTTMEDVAYLTHLVAEISFLNHSEMLNLAPLNLRSIIQAVIDSFTTTAAVLDKKIQLSLTSSDPVPDILGDYTKLKQVIVNILKNAVEASPDNASIHIDLSLKNESICISVHDHGCGMTPEQLENIFLPMVTYKEGGTGLGLPISQKIIQAHHGTISVTSVPGEGSTFKISLPI